MNTPRTEYVKLLNLIQSKNRPAQAVLVPSTEKIYTIDLNTRKIESPEFLSVATDHAAEVIYFKFNRYFDGMDLANTVCIIQFINAKKENRLYVVPYYDMITLEAENEIIIPWLIEGEATKVAGNVTYAFRFYNIAADGQKIDFNLNTLSATSKVLNGIAGSDFSQEYEEPYPETLESIAQRLFSLEDSYQLYWTELY